MGKWITAAVLAAAFLIIVVYDAAHKIRSGSRLKDADDNDDV